MRYSYEFRLMCVELYRSGSYPDIPEGMHPDTLKRHIREWSRFSLYFQRQNCFHIHRNIKTYPYANQISHSNFQIHRHQNTFLFVHIHFYPHLIPANYLMQSNYFLSFLYFLGNNLLFPYT